MACANLQDVMTTCDDGSSKKVSLLEKLEFKCVISQTEAIEAGKDGIAHHDVLKSTLVCLQLKSIIVQDYSSLLEIGCPVVSSIGMAQPGIVCPLQMAQRHLSPRSVS
ncbi:hypothetical protein Btru_070699 [Bulinus truncatus]|nr:hypothetical protein Btru_070699 [Bulinus truncatus]